LSRRTIVLVVLLLCVLFVGGWVMLGHARPTPARAGSPIDIETPAGRARLDAVIALARMPDDPWTLAESIPVAPAASGPTSSKGRCGEDQLPVYDETPQADGMIHPPLAEIRPAGVGYLGARRRIDAALRASADPFDRSVADALNVDDVLTRTGQLDALVQDAMTSNDPRIYALAFDACDRAGMETINGPAPAVPAGCTQLDAHEWARRDPGNAVPWLHALQQADKAGDQVAQREALQRVASSPRFDVHFGAAGAAVASLQVPTDADLTGQGVLAVQALGFEMMPSFAPLAQRCQDKAGGDAEMAVTCETIADVLFDHSDGFLTRSMGGAIHRQVTGDSSRLDQVRREQRAYGEHWKPATGFSPCEDERQTLKRIVRIGTIGELAMMKEDLRTPMPP
jgi:hypothetical protein